MAFDLLPMGTGAALREEALMIKIRKILYPTDLSEYALHALP